MQLISTFSFVEISTFFSVIEMYIKMSEISNFWLSVLISQVAPYLMFILVSKSTHPVSLVLSSQNAQCFYISVPLLFHIAIGQAILAAASTKRQLQTIGYCMLF